MSYRIKRVDGTDPDIADEIEYLRRIVSPQDEKTITDKGWWWLGYDPEGVAIAFAGLHRSVRVVGRGYLCRAGVHPDHRGHGLQRRLIRARVRYARLLVMTDLVSDTIEHNAPSANNLIACGFRLWDPGKETWGVAGSVYWRLKL